MWSGLLWLFFFFKQKTAYELRISDWSSDVCSSDLLPARPWGGVRMVIKRIDVFSAGKIMGIIAAAIGLIAGILFLLFGSVLGSLVAASGQGGGGIMAFGGIMGVIVLPIMYGIFGFIGGVIQAFVYNLAAGRSEEHTSE